MEPTDAIVIRFDFVLKSETENLLSSLRNLYGEQGSNVHTVTTIGGSDWNVKTFSSDSPTSVSHQFNYYDNIRTFVLQEPQTVVDVLTIGIVKEDIFENALQNFNRHASVYFQSWQRRIDSIQDHIPTIVPDDAGGPAILYVALDEDFNQLPDDNPDIEAVRDELSNHGELAEALCFSYVNDFTILSEETLLILQERGQIWRRLTAIDLAGNIQLTKAGGFDPVLGRLYTLLPLFRAHYLNHKRSNDLEDISKRMESILRKIEDEGTNGRGEINQDLYSLENDWIPLQRAVSTETHELTRLLRRYNFDSVGTGKEYFVGHQEGEPLTQEGDLLDVYKQNLLNLYGEMETELNRIDRTINRLADSVNSRITISSIRESTTLQSRVRWLTWALAILTAVLVLSQIQLLDSVLSIFWRLSPIVIAAAFILYIVYFEV